MSKVINGKHLGDMPVDSVDDEFTPLICILQLVYCAVFDGVLRVAIIAFVALVCRCLCMYSVF